MTLLPRPGALVVFCPSCTHAISKHSTYGCAAWGPNPAKGGKITNCNCLWTPNDIASSSVVVGAASPPPLTPARMFHDPMCSEDLEDEDEFCHCVLIARVRAQDMVQVSGLEKWKREALEVLAEWEKAHEVMGSPAKIGESKAKATAAHTRKMAGRIGLFEAFLIEQHLEETFDNWVKTQEEGKK